ncbi:aldo/keto reductase [Spongiactinospora sp. 9N601]|uniref:aldo/keto reductase n=1 Tax=Spongiactinospora sp. 9N601 TaxID=3375149 RepID=UPI0037AB3B90
MSTTIPIRRLGGDGPLASVLSLGSWHTYDRMDFGDAVAMLRKAVDLGINLFDVGVYSMPGYPPVFTDVLFSAMVRAAGIKRDEYLLSTKLWLDGYPERPLRAQLENALFRVGADRADVAVLGDIRSDRVNLQRLALDLAALEADGLIGWWGVNNWSTSTILEIRRHAHSGGSPGPQFAQLKYSPCRRTIADGEPFAELWELGIGLQASDVMEGGILAGRLTPTRPIGRDPGDVRSKIMESAEGIARVAADLGVTPARLCVAFCLTHPAIASVLFGVTKEEQLLDNVAALELVEKVGAERIRELLDPFWADRDAVAPEGP